MSVPKLPVIVLAILASIPAGSAALALWTPPEPVAVPLALPALGVDATIIRDAWGVPHIYADDAYSLFFANGYAQAQDRLAQMEILRHVGTGRLAELTGPSGLELDLITRRELYTDEERIDALEALPQQWQDAFQAFADGVNHWIVEATATGDLPVEYPALVAAPVPWQATDTVAIAQYLLDVFGRGSGGQEAVNAQILAQLKQRLGDADGAAAFNDMVWGVNTDTYTTIKNTDTNTPWQPLASDLPHDLTAFNGALPTFGAYCFVDDDGSTGHDPGESIYVTHAASCAGTVAAGDLRLAPVGPQAAGTQVATTHFDFGDPYTAFSPSAVMDYYDADADTSFSLGDTTYIDADASGTVTLGDLRITAFGTFAPGSSVGSGNPDVNLALMGSALVDVHDLAFYDADGDQLWSSGDAGYADVDDNGVVSIADIRLASIFGEPYGAQVTAGDADLNNALVASGTFDTAQSEAYAAALQAENVQDTFAPVSQILAEAGWPFKFGSNAQLIDESLAANGKPMLYGGPQMGYFAPSIPYELGLHGAGFDAVGMGVAGAPGVIIGRSANLSWTITSGASDQVDVVVERLVDHDTYIVDGEEIDMDCRTETHLVRPGPVDFAPDADPNWRPPVPEVVLQEVCRTIHGPVLARTPDGGYAFSSYRSYRGDEVRSGSLWLQIGTVQSLGQMQDLFETFMFTFNFNAVSADGHLLYMHVGAQPIRDDRLDPRLPMPGWDSSYDWKGLRTGRDLPHVIDPASGYTVNWNNKPTANWMSGDARENWGEIHRAELMSETLLAKIGEVGLLTMDDLRDVNEYASTHEPYADDFLDVWRDAALAIGNASVVAAIDDWSADGFDYADRDGDGFHDHPAFRLYELWLSNYVRAVLIDELGGFVRDPEWAPGVNGADPHAADHGEHGNKFNVLVDAYLGESNRAWCDRIPSPSNQTPQPPDLTETCLDMSIEALGAAITDNPDWADPFPQRVSPFTAMGAQSGWKIPMTNRPSFQHFYDWGLPEGDTRSRNVLPPGASGHMNPVDFLMFQGWLNDVPEASPPPHMIDQLDLYVQFGDKPLLHSLAAVEAYEESRTVFGQG